VAQSRIADVWDKGKAAVIIQESTATTLAGDPLWTTRSGIFARGEGGFGGSRGSSDRLPAPVGDPVLEVEVPTLPQQALLYRLCGDRNPLHADPSFAAMAGFDRPILHGLCTYGVVCKALVDNLLAGDVTKVGTFSTRFAGILFPGETIRVRAWQTETGYQATATAVDREDASVLDETVLSLR
jgi:acyl dehydratase